MSVRTNVLVVALSTVALSPVFAQGADVFVGGEEGYAFPAHTYARVNGEWVCTDKIAHNPAPEAIKTPAERQAFQQQYPA